VTVLKKHTRKCLAIVVARRDHQPRRDHDAGRLFFKYGVPEHISSDNGPEIVAKAVREGLSDRGVMTLFIEPGSPGRTAAPSRRAASCPMSH
jgi:putative transposase